MNKLRKMKTVIILTAVLLTGALFASCNSDDDGGSEPSIVGAWLETSRSTEEFTNNVSEGTTTGTVDAENFTRLTFNADGTFSDFSSESVNGAVETSTDPGTYTVNGNILSITYDGDTDVETIEFTVSATQFIFDFVEEYTESGSGDQKRFVTTSTYNRQ